MTVEDMLRQLMAVVASGKVTGKTKVMFGRQVLGKETVVTEVKKLVATEGKLFIKA